MKTDHPGLVISGTQHGYFSISETQSIIDAINASGAKILLVAMGVPHQEHWISRHLDALNVNVVMGVGGLFDFVQWPHSPGPPCGCGAVVSNGSTGLRQEPGRMWRRYILGNPLFVWRTWQEQRQAQQQGLFQWNGTRPHCGVGFFAPARAGSLKVHFIAQPSACSTRRWAGLGLIALAPFFLIIAAAIKFESPGPVFFSQRRVGLKGQRFRMWKFRSMVC